MSEALKIYGVVQFVKKGSPTMATFIMDERLLNEDYDAVPALVGSVLDGMNWKAENTDVEVKCYKVVPSWEKTFKFEELDKLAKLGVAEVSKDEPGA